MADLPHYDPQEPAHLQETDADCAPESTEWALFAYGRTPDDDWIEQSMYQAGVWNPSVGLTDASGGLLAEWLRTEYGEFGYTASNENPVSFDQVASEAATLKHPLLIGGRAWCHWTGVRGYSAAKDLLLLANPAPGYRNVWSTMNRAQFESLGTFSLVRLTHPAAEAGGEGGGGGPAAVVAGPDVSSHQGAVDWGAVKAAGAAFGFTKASGGAWYTNPTLAANWQGMKAAGLARGAYHYAFESSGQPYPGPGPEAEAEFFLSRVLALGLEPGDMLALDIEEGPSGVNLGAWALAWAERVEAVAGLRPLVYTGAWFTDAHGFADVPELARYPLWLAAYQTQQPSVPAPWSSWAFWQFTCEASVAGITGPCDMNRFAGTLEELPAYGMPAEPPVSGGDGGGDFVVGQGIAEEMARCGDAAGSDEIYLKSATKDAWSEAFGTSGCRYVWLPAVGRVFRYPPA